MKILRAVLTCAFMAFITTMLLVVGALLMVGIAAALVFIGSILPGIVLKTLFVIFLLVFVTLLLSYTEWAS